jgi:hypothetical protein
LSCLLLYEVVLLSNGFEVASSEPLNFTVQSPALSFTERVQSLPAAEHAIGERHVALANQNAQIVCPPGDGTDSANVTFVTGALDIGRRHASHSFDEDYVQNLRHMLFLRVMTTLHVALLYCYRLRLNHSHAGSHRRIYRCRDPCKAKTVSALAFYRATCRGDPAPDFISFLGAGGVCSLLKWLAAATERL